MAKEQEPVKDPKRCQGWRRYGGAFTIGLPRWEQCKKTGVVMITFKEDGKIRTLPGCTLCWEQLIDQEKANLLKIITVVPVKKEKK